MAGYLPASTQWRGGIAAMALFCTLPAETSSAMPPDHRPAHQLISCGNIDFGEGVVASVIDGRALRLTDGREIRLKGLAATALLAPGTPSADTARRIIADRVASGKVALRGSDPTPDRYGRQHAVVTPAGSNIPLQAALLEAGAAVASGTEAQNCNEELLHAEAAARRAKRSVWDAPSAIKNADKPADVLAERGQFVIVEGKIRSVRQSGSMVYVNFGRRWTEGFTVTIPRQTQAPLEGAGIKILTLTGHHIRVRGVAEQRSGPRIHIRHVGQNELLGSPDAMPASSEATSR